MLAAQDSVQADCRRHRERATLRLRRCLEDLDNEGAGLAPEREKLMVDLAQYAQAYDEDPQAAALVKRCREAGVLK